jgi:hypothetical protein
MFAWRFFFIFHRQIENVLGTSCKVPDIFFCPILAKFGFSEQTFILVPPIPNFTEIHPEASALIHADGRKDMTNLTGVFRDYANAPITETNCVPGILYGIFNSIG